MTYTGLFSLKITMVRVPAVARTGLLKVRLKSVRVGTSTKNETDPKALE